MSVGGKEHGADNAGEETRSVHTHLRQSRAGCTEILARFFTRFSPEGQDEHASY
jgi:hypothetical protein